MSATGRPSRMPLLAFGVAATVLLAHAALFADIRLDDVFVSLRYARHVAQGQGWVFNEGGERVEGFSSPAMVGLLAIASRLGFDGLTSARVVSLLGALLLLTGTLRLVREWTGSAVGLFVSGLVVAGSTPVAVAVASGLEWTLFAGLCAWGLALCQSELSRTRMYAGILLGLATLVRPEGTLAFACAFFLADGRVLSTASLGWRWTSLALPWAVFGIPSIIARASYFGKMAGNVLVARTQPHALNRWRSGLTYFGAYALATLLAFGLVLFLWKGLRERRQLVVTSFVMLWSAFIVTTGGDRVEGGILFVPLLPFAAVAFGSVLTRPVSLALAGGLLALSTWLTTATAHWNLRQETMRALAGRRATGASLASQKHLTIATSEPGEIGFFSGAEIIDLSGLTDRELGKLIHKGTGEYDRQFISQPDAATARKMAEVVLDRRPDVVVFHLQGEEPIYAADAALPRHPRFLQDYVAGPAIPGRGGWEYRQYKRSSAPAAVGPE